MFFKRHDRLVWQSARAADISDWLSEAPDSRAVSILLGDGHGNNFKAYKWEADNFTDIVDKEILIMGGLNDDGEWDGGTQWHNVIWKTKFISDEIVYGTPNTPQGIIREGVLKFNFSQYKYPETIRLVDKPTILNHNVPSESPDKWAKYNNDGRFHTRCYSTRCNDSNGFNFQAKIVAPYGYHGQEHPNDDGDFFVVFQRITYSRGEDTMNTYISANCGLGYESPSVDHHKIRVQRRGGHACAGDYDVVAAKGKAAIKFHGNHALK